MLLHQFEMDAVVILPSKNRIQRLYTDKTGEFIERGSRRVCQTIAIELEFAATVTLQQIGVSERDGRSFIENNRVGA